MVKGARGARTCLKMGYMRRSTKKSKKRGMPKRGHVVKKGVRNVSKGILSKLIYEKIQ